MSNASDRLMIVRLKLSQWSGRKYDAKASEEVAERHGAKRAKQVGRFNKVLVERDEEALADLTYAFGQLRSEHYALTAPWDDEGLRVLPIELFDEYCRVVREWKDEINGLVDAFCAKYPDLVKEARVRLNGLFNEADYPPVGEIRSRFAVEYYFDTLPDSDNVKVWRIDDAEKVKIVENNVQRTNAAVERAHQDVVDRVVARAAEFVEKVQKFDAKESTKQKGERNALRESALLNLRDIVNLVSNGLNITNDKALTDLAAELNAKIDDIEIEDLKEDHKVRIKTVADVEKTLKKFDGMFGKKKAGSKK